MSGLDEKPGCIDPNQPHSDCLSVSLRALVFVVLVLVLLVGCTTTRYERREIEGVECVNAQDTGAISCDWDRAKDRQKPERETNR